MDCPVDDVVVLVDWSAGRALAPLAVACASDAAACAGVSGVASPRWSGLLLDEPGIAIGAAARLAPRARPTEPLPDAAAGGLTVVAGERIGSADGRFRAISWDPGRRQLTVEGDVLGTVPLYLWRSADLLVLSSTLKAFRLLPFVRLEADPEALAAVITLGFPLGTRTLLRGVSALPADAVVRCEPSGVTVLPRHSIRAGEEVPTGFAGRRADEIVEAFDATVVAGTEAWLRGRDRPMVSLSGGLDSRLALAYVAAAGAEPTAATWGFPGMGDAVIAGRVAAAAHVPHRLVPLAVDVPWTAAELQSSAWRLETFGAVSLPFYARDWARFLATATAAPAVHGFVGDTLGGANLGMYGVDAATVPGPAEGAETAFRAFVQRRAPDHVTRIATPAFAKVLRETVPDAALAQYRALPDACAYQRLIRFDLLARQGRYIAGSASKLLASYRPLVLPFYTRAQIELALQLPADALLSRAAVRRLLVRRFPALARIPLTGETGLPGYRSRAHEWLDRPARAVRARRRHWQGVFRTFGSLLGGHRDVVVTTLDSAAPLLEPYLDPAALIRYVDETSGKAAAGVPQGDRRFILRTFNAAAFLSAMTEPASAQPTAITLPDAVPVAGAGVGN